MVQDPNKPNPAPMDSLGRYITVGTIIAYPGTGGCGEPRMSFYKVTEVFTKTPENCLRDSVVVKAKKLEGYSKRRYWAKGTRVLHYPSESVVIPELAFEYLIAEGPPACMTP